MAWIALRAACTALRGEGLGCLKVALAALGGGLGVSWAAWGLELPWGGLGCC